jgi:hypothetical protein
VGVPVRERGGLAGPCSVTLSGLSRLSTVEVAHIDLLGTVRSLKVESVAVERHGRPTFASSTNSIVGCGIVNIPHEQHAIQEQPAVPPGLQKHNPLARWRASRIPDSGPNKVRPGMEDGKWWNGAENSRLSSRMRP